MKNILIKTLLTFIVLTGLLIAGLNMLGGTSESHKSGLESAFSSALQGNVRFGVLRSFNVFPQFSVDIENMEATSVLKRGNLRAKHVRFSFDFWDILLKHRNINSLDIEGLVIGKGIYTDEPLFVSSAMIHAEKKDEAPFILITGTYGDFPLNIRSDMDRAGKSIPPSYFFGSKNPFTVELGITKVSGDFTPGTKENTALQNLKISRNGKACTSLPAKNKFTMQGFTTYMFSEIVASEKENGNIEKLCKDVMKFGL